jgi:hypothetical protein
LKENKGGVVIGEGVSMLGGEVFCENTITEKCFARVAGTTLVVMQANLISYEHSGQDYTQYILPIAGLGSWRGRKKLNR